MILGAQARLYEPFDKRVAMLKVLGFKAVEIPALLGFDIVRFDQAVKSGETQKVREAAAKLSEQGITVAAIGNYFYNPCHPDRKIYRHLFDRTVENIKLSSELKDRPTIFISGGSLNPEGNGWMPHKDNYTDHTLQTAVKNLKGICKVAEDHDVNLGLEVGVVTVACSSKRCVKIIEEVGSDNLKIHMDVCNLVTFPFAYYNSTEFINELFDDLKGTIIDGHLKDFTVELGHNITSVMKHVPPGKGNMDWDTYLKRLSQEVGPKGYAIFEYVNLDELPEARAFIEAKAKSLGIIIQ